MSHPIDALNAPIAGIVKKYGLEITATGGQPEWNRKCVRYEDPAKKIRLYIFNGDAPFVLVNDVSVDDLFLEHIAHEQIRKLDKFISKHLA